MMAVVGGSNVAYESRPANVLRELAGHLGEAYFADHAWSLVALQRFEKSEQSKQGMTEGKKKQEGEEGEDRQEGEERERQTGLLLSYGEDEDGENGERGEGGKSDDDGEEEKTHQNNNQSNRRKSVEWNLPWLTGSEFSSSPPRLERSSSGSSSSSSSSSMTSNLRDTV
jgi:hypothetical protein